MPEIDEITSSREYVLRQIQNNFKEERIVSAMREAYIYAVFMKRKNYADYFRKQLQKVELRRRLGYRESLVTNPATSAEYWDEDKRGDPYPFDLELEKRMIEIELKILEFVALCLDDLKGNDDMGEFFKLAGGA